MSSFPVPPPLAPPSQPLQPSLPSHPSHPSHPSLPSQPSLDSLDSLQLNNNLELVPSFVPPPPALPPSSSSVSSTFSSSTASSTASSTLTFSSPPPPVPSTVTTSDGGSAPHLEDPLVAPRAQKVDPEIPANMARNLDESLRGVSSPVPASLNNPGGQGGYYNPGGFNIPGVSRSPQPPSQAWTPSLPYPNPTPNPNPHRSYYGGYGGYGGPVDAGYGQQQQQPQRMVSPSPTISQHITHPPSSSSSSSLTAPLPTIPSLSSSTPTPTSDPALKVAWSRDVLFLIERAHALASGSPPGEPINGPVLITDKPLLDLANIAIPFLLQIASLPNPSPSTPYIAESIYHRASLLASGAFPEYTPKNPRSAFRDFESAARAGYPKAWFRIGRDYEGFGDTTHARECFERGVRAGVAGCLYRLGMAHLLGQLSLPVSHTTALPLLHRAALASTLDTPQPAYVYALLLLGEFTQSHIDPGLFAQLHLLPVDLMHLGPRGLLLEARTHLTTSAYLHFSPAQYKLGHAYEFATPPFEFDALLSVEWYSRASQQGETEADMALSKWFLCGSRISGPNNSPPSTSSGGFDKDEQLALIFASKAALKGLPSAEFAMGYYHEVGIGGPIDIDEALRWYALAQRHGNTDAGERLAALSQPAPQVLSRVEHDEITESKLVRSRTRAKERSEAQKVRDGYLAGQPQPQPQVQGQGQGQGRRRDSRQVVDLIRKNTLGSYQPQPQPQPQQTHGRYHTEANANANTLPPNQVGITISRPPSAHPHPQSQPPPHPYQPPPPHSYQPQPQPQSQIPPPYTQPPLPSSSSSTQNPHPIQNPNQNPTLRPGPSGPGGSQSYPTANRYTLVDPGSGSAPRSDSRSPSNRGDSRSPSTGPGSRPPPRRGPSGGIVVSGGVSTSASPYNSNPNPYTSNPSSNPSNPTTGPTGVPGAPPPPTAAGGPAPPRPTGPQTFAEMGISGAKAEDEKCVVM
ncbi:hypothetical protein F5051DRAFT_456705 [Lentinula edodes]|nr:hypothetical protein F5051DRAFT_456705 [Lentinula edodes]